LFLFLFLLLLLLFMFFFLVRNCGVLFCKRDACVVVKDVVMMWSIISSICLVIHPSIRLVIHPSHRGLFTRTKNDWLCLEGLSCVGFPAFAFPVLPFSSQSGKVYEKKQEKKKTCLWWKNRKNTYYLLFKNPIAYPT